MRRTEIKNLSQEQKDNYNYVSFVMDTDCKVNIKSCVSISGCNLVEILIAVEKFMHGYTSESILGARILLLFKEDPVPEGKYLSITIQLKPREDFFHKDLFLAINYI